MKELHHGDRVKYVNKDGSTGIATIVMKSALPDVWVANAGGRFGKPILIHDNNFAGFAKQGSVGVKSHTRRS